MTVAVSFFLCWAPYSISLIALCIPRHWFMKYINVSMNLLLCYSSKGKTDDIVEIAGSLCLPRSQRNPDCEVSATRTISSSEIFKFSFFMDYILNPKFEISATSIIIISATKISYFFYLSFLHGLNTNLIPHLEFLSHLEAPLMIGWVLNAGMNVNADRLRELWRVPTRNIHFGCLRNRSFVTGFDEGIILGTNL